MASIIGRAGVLATPSTFLYGLAGWSYGQFDASNVNFGFGKIQDYDADGLTVGGGFEKKLSPSWSIRAEYRYTNFGSENLSARTTSSFSQSSSETGQDSNSSNGTSSSSTSTQTDVDNFVSAENSQGSVDNDMHVGRIGVTRYFTMND